jgi:hypothetical protein
VSCLSLIPQLEYLSLEFDDSQLAASEPHHFGSLQNYKSPPAETQKVLLPKSDEIVFRGTCTYLEGLASSIRTLRLACFRVEFFPRPSIRLPRLSEFIIAAEELGYPVSSLTFSGMNEDGPSVSISVAGLKQTADQSPEDAPLCIHFPCRNHLDEQVACAAIVCTALLPMLSEDSTSVITQRAGLEGFRPSQRSHAKCGTCSCGLSAT